MQKRGQIGETEQCQCRTGAVTNEHQPIRSVQSMLASDCGCALDQQCCPKSFTSAASMTFNTQWTLQKLQERASNELEGRRNEGYKS
ncbi:hypothetical protein PoB_007235000 [Plakobranchus ocellatus]|uniref:Uncharacterized protein n=1 Tax=Plakobranchus ocellatus TaxID=259542 RepID=A0AAV4DPI6_9GAST|nr:hypothetical protein PoB_007235000 [Plakobranchus ocellatus]